MSDPGIQYTDPKQVTDVSMDSQVPQNPYASGYGARIPTPYRVRYGSRWHRVYVMCWSNMGTSYIRSGGGRLVIDSDTEHRLTSLER